MIIKFRQGVVSYPTSGGVQQFLVPTGNNISLNVVNGVVDIAVAHKSSDYLHTESVSVPNAWGPLPAPAVAATVWLYWDFNTLTAVRSFGFTVNQPVNQPTAPLTPAVDQHWFDTVKSVMFVWNGTRWQEKIRVFAAAVNTTTKAFTSLSVFSGQQDFTGSQIGYQDGISGLQVSVSAGRIIVNNAGKPILNQTNEFFTTEDDFFINGSPINTIRMEANILNAKAIESIAEYQVVKFTSFGNVALAGYNDLQTTAIAIAVQDVVQDGIGAFVVQGIITNPVWNWPAVGQELWVSENGMLVTSDPHVSDTSTYNQGKAPVGRVLSPQSIIFDQGLGGKGDKGESALDEAGTSGAATQFKLGKVKLSCAPADPGTPFAVETSDPRMTDARHPLQHRQPATDIDPAVYGTNINGDLQTTLQNIENSKLNRSGSQPMTGDLTLYRNPTDPLHAVPKQYVDTFIPLAQKGTANGVATLDHNSKITASQLPQISITDTFVVASESEMVALNAQTGDLAVRTDIHTTYILKGSVPTVISDWEELLTRPDGVVSIDVQPATNQKGIVTSGGPVTSEGTIRIALADDLAALENLNGVGIAHRTGHNTWITQAVDLSPSSGSVNGVLSMSNGGTGLSTVTGYIKGNGTSYTALATIPGADVSGTVPAAATVAWPGVTNKPTTIAGYGITDAYTKPETSALVWSWNAITSTPSTLVGYGITDVFSKTEVTNFLLLKADKATTLAGYGIGDAALATHNHTLDSLANVNTTSKTLGDIITWNGSTWGSTPLSNSVLPSTISNKTFDETNTITIKDTNFTIVDSADTTKKFSFLTSGLTTNTAYIYAVPAASGTLVLTNGIGASGNWNINATSASSVSWAGVVATPTTLAGYGITDAYTKTQTDLLTWNWSAITTGKPTTLGGYGITDAYTKNQTDLLTWNWSAITNKPTDAASYGITDVYTKAQSDALTWNWSAITTGKPTTLGGYGIIDAAPIAHHHDATYAKLSELGISIAELDFTGKLVTAQLPDSATTHVYQVNTEAAMLSLLAYPGDIVIRPDVQQTFVLNSSGPSVLSNWSAIIAPSGPAGTITSVSVASAPAGVVASGSPITTSGTITLSLADDLAAVEGLNTTGYVKRTAADTWSTTTTIPAYDITGILPIANGGTGSAIAADARANLDVPSTTGTGATGTWDISVSGNAATATDGVITTGSYNDPIWIASLSPTKVVATWGGSHNINTVGPEVSFGLTSVVRTGVIPVSSAAVTIDSFSTVAPTAFSAAKYIIRVRGVATASVVELYIVLDAANNVYFNQTVVGNNTCLFSASYNADVVTITATPSIAENTTYAYSATLLV